MQNKRENTQRTRSKNINLNENHTTNETETKPNFQLTFIKIHFQWKTNVHVKH